jgi:hypothetical protein
MAAATNCGFRRIRYFYFRLHTSRRDVPLKVRVHSAHWFKSYSILSIRVAFTLEKFYAEGRNFRFRGAVTQKRKIIGWFDRKETHLRENTSFEPSVVVIRRSIWAARVTTKGKMKKKLYDKSTYWRNAVT